MLIKKFLSPSLMVRVIARGNVRIRVGKAESSHSHPLPSLSRRRSRSHPVPSPDLCLTRTVISPDLCLSRSLSRALSPPFPLSADLSLRLCLPTFPLSPDLSLELYLRRSICLRRSISPALSPDVSSLRWVISLPFNLSAGWNRNKVTLNPLSSSL